MRTWTVNLCADASLLPDRKPLKHTWYLADLLFIERSIRVLRIETSIAHHSVIDLSILKDWPTTNDNVDQKNNPPISNKWTGCRPLSKNINRLINECLHIHMLRNVIYLTADRACMNDNAVAQLPRQVYHSK